MTYYLLSKPFLRVKTCYECEDHDYVYGPSTNEFTCPEEQTNADFRQTICRGSCKTSWDNDENGKLVTKRFCSIVMKPETADCDYDNPTDGQECFCNGDLCNGLPGGGSGIAQIFSFLIWFSISVQCFCTFFLF